jgi:hypothetical protein
MTGIGTFLPIHRQTRLDPSDRFALGHSCRVGPGNFTPSPSQIPDLTLSRHPARATARRLPPSIEHRVPPVAGCPDLKCDDLLPSLHGHYTRFITTTKQSAPSRRIGTFSLTVSAACALSLGIASLGSHVPYKSPVELRAAYMPDAAWAVSGHPPS